MLRTVYNMLWSAFGIFRFGTTGYGADRQVIVMEEDQKISFQLKSINEKIRQVGDATFARYGLTGPQVGYIGYIHRAGGFISQSDLEKAVGVSHPTIVGIVARLNEKGYVEIKTDEKDRRKRIIILTDKAKEVKHYLDSDYEKMYTGLFKGMSLQEKHELIRFLDLISSNLQSIRNE